MTERQESVSTVESMQNQSTSPDSIRNDRQRLVRMALRVLVGLGTLGVAVSGYNSYIEGDLMLVFFYVGAYITLLLLAFWKKIAYEIQAGVLVFLVYGLGALGLYESGLSGDGRVFLLVVPFMASILFGPRVGIATAALSVLTLAGFGWGFSTGRLSLPVDVQANTANPGSWTSGGIVFTMLTVAIVVFLNYLVPRLSNALLQSRKLTQDLESRGEQLRELLEERTVELERRSVQLQTAAQVAREAASIQDQERLLDEVVRLISRQFGFYHAGIFLLDVTEEYMELRAVSSVEGQQMLKRRHRLRIGETGVVGYAAESGEAHIARDVGEDAAYFDNPDLVETRSEVALPLQTQERIIGVLDVQSKRVNAFTDDDVLVLQALADQIALVINNVQLLEELEERLEAERRAYGEVSRAEWQAFLKSKRSLGYTRVDRGLNPADNQWTDFSLAAVERGEPVLDAQTGRTLAVPVRVRGQVIGVIDAHKRPNGGAWKEAEQTLLVQLGEQIELALENARLYEDTQRRAARERLTTEVTARMRETLDMETVLRTAVQEISEALDLAALDVRLGVDNQA